MLFADKIHKAVVVHELDRLLLVDADAPANRGG